MHTLEETFSPTPLQEASDDTLRSEQQVGKYFPRVLSRIDLLVVFIAVVVFIPDSAVVQTTQAAGPVTYVYWLVGTVTFLVPGAIVVAQLNRFLPVDGSIYVWTHRALGSLWGSFAAFCAWFPGILVLLTAGDFVRSLIQGIGLQAFGNDANWLADPWQQGVLVLLMLVVGGWLSTLPLPLLMRWVRYSILLYGLGIFSIGLAGLVWLLTGHPSQAPLMPTRASFGSPNFALYGAIVLALLGIEVPLNMAAETKQRNAPALFLRWGPLLVLVAYLLSTFGVAAVVPPGSAGLENSTLLAVRIVFGAPAAILVGLIFIGFYVTVTVIYITSFARILFVAALDHRLPLGLTRVNRFNVPSAVVHVQLIIVAIIAIVIYFIGPVFYPGTNFSVKVYYVIEAATTIIWCLSMIILFLDLPFLLHRFRELFAKRRGQLIAPPWLLYLSCIVGGGASLVGIWATLNASWDETLIATNQWWIIVGGAVLASLVIGLLGSAYPRLLSSLEEQTAAARENARLYSELRTTYARLSELDHLKDAFLATVSHELRTPLTIVQGYLELLGEIQDLDTGTRRDFLNKARWACEELVLLQANIMDASRISFDTATLQCASLPLKEVCTSVVELFEPVILQEQRQVNINIDPSMRVWADEIRLKQIFRNLIANALRYSPAQTPLAISAVEEQEQGMARLKVIDRGWGIPPEKQEAIFERFVRLERDLHGANRGSGLGLAITRQLVEAMQGTIAVESSGISGEGSTFTFTLPVAPPGALNGNEG